MAKKPATTSGKPSPLRRARTDRNETLEQVIAGLCELDPEAGGITPSMLSGWERGRHATSPRYRALLCDYYERSSAELFAHQDEQLATGPETPRLLVGHRDLLEALTGVVRRAERFLVATGSRSRDAAYLAEIEAALADKPDLVH